MSRLTRRRLMLGGLAAAGSSAAAAHRYGLVPPDYAGLGGLGETATYAAQRLLTANSMAREFSRSQISKTPFPNTQPLQLDPYKKLQADGFRAWRLVVDGMVANPASFSMSDLRAMPAKSQITQLVCEEGWSFIAEWVGVPLQHILREVGASPAARYVMTRSMEPGWSDSIDMADAWHPQTFMTYAMNGADLTPGHGGPLRIRVPRQLGYKSVKFIDRLTVSDRPGDSSVYIYSWYAGI